MDRPGRDSQTMNSDPHGPDSARPTRLRRRGVLYLSILVAAIAALIAWRLGQSFEKRLLDQARTTVENRLRGLATTLASEISQRQSAVTALAAFTRVYGTDGSMQREFPIYAAGLHATDPIIRAIQVYPADGSVLAFPEEDGAQIAGRTLHDLIHDERPGVRADVQRTIASRAVTVSAPYALRQGGKGVVVRQAVHHDDTLEGIVVVVLDLEPLLDRAGVLAASSDLRLAIRGGDGELFHGDAGIPAEEAVLLQAPIASGSWTLAALPQEGWLAGARNPLNLFRLAGLLIALVLGSATWLIASRQTALQQTVQARTRELNQREQALRQSEARYRTLIENAPLAIFINRDDRVVLANQACARLFGSATPEALIGKSPFELFHPDDHPRIRARIQRLRVESGPVPMIEERIVRLDGSVVEVEVNAAPFVDQGSKAIHVVLRDITERKQGEFERQKAYDLLTKLAAQVPGVVYQYLFHPDGRSCFPYASPGLREIYECEPEDVRADASSILERLHPEDRERVMAEIAESARTLAPFHCEYRVVLPRQGLRWRLSDATPGRTADGATLWHGIISDITDRKHAEQALRASVDEKEALLREVHHRVKNNLQVITSLLRLQAARAEGPGAREVLAEMQDRIRSMALLHETLHRSDDLARVDLGAYVESICRHILRAAGRNEAGGVHTVLDLHHVHVTAEQAAPCGLIANELLSNAMKHAFPSGRPGRIRVALWQAETDRRIHLEVSDDGVGLPHNFDELRENSLGLQLVSDLCKQLDGALHVGQGAGTMFSVNFPPHGSD